MEISIHALLAESDAVHFDTLSALTPISIHALLAESDIADRYEMGIIRQISIHALLAESDEGAHRLAHAPPEISIHALLAESDCKNWRKQSIHHKFLSTLSLRRATRGGDPCYLDNIISIHALLAESDQTKALKVAAHSISIHALLAESDHWYKLSYQDMRGFLSTLSLRRATGVLFLIDEIQLISIHALLAESDGRITSNGTKKLNFYPRSPCGERLSILTRCQP